MKRPPNCSLCMKDPKLADRCTQAAREGWNDSRIAIELLGSRGRRSALQTHLDHIPGLNRTPEVNNGRPEGPPPAPPASPVAPISLDEVTVISELAVMYGEACAELARRKLGTDRVAIDTAAEFRAKVWDRFAKVLKLPGFGDGSTTITIDNSTRRLELAIAGMSTEQLHAFLEGKDVPALTTSVNDETIEGEAEEIAS